MDKTLDLDEMERWAKRPGVWHHQWFTREEILTLIAAARPAVVSDEVVERMCAMLDANFRQTKEGWPEFTDYRASCIAAMRAALALLPGGVPDREAIARVIEPDEYCGEEYNARRRNDALAKADAIISMLSASPKGASVAESAAGDASHLTASETPCKSEGAQ